MCRKGCRRSAGNNLPSAPYLLVACYRNIILGQMVDEGVAIGPVELKYEDGVHQMTVEASKDAAGNYHINVLPN